MVVAKKRGLPPYSSPFRAAGSPWEEQGFSTSCTHAPGSCAEGLLLAERSGAPFPTHHSLIRGLSTWGETMCK